jgi:hypothetical protein
VSSETLVDSVVDDELARNIEARRKEVEAAPRLELPSEGIGEHSLVFVEAPEDRPRVVVASGGAHRLDARERAAFAMEKVSGGTLAWCRKY